MRRSRYRLRFVCGACTFLVPLVATAASVPETKSAPAVAPPTATETAAVPATAGAVVVAPAMTAIDDEAARQLDLLGTALAGRIDPRVVDVLPRIDGVGARLLALRSYLRSGERLGERWSWTAQQITAYEGSPEQLELDAEVQRVRAAFERVNPGYELFVNPQVRSLDTQLHNWNRTESVAVAAARLLQDARVALAGHPGDLAAREAALREFLLAYKPEPVPTVAAPGLSPHGQMRAIDFQVHRGAEIVAGPDTRTIAEVWQQAGWAARLAAAISAASSKFIGPLASPAEPWHYTYTPVAVADQ